MLGVQLGHMAGRAARETRWGLGTLHPHQSHPQRGDTPPLAVLQGSLWSHPGTLLAILLPEVQLAAG